MKTFGIYYSGAIYIEAETEGEAEQIFYSKYYDYGNIDEIEVEEDD